MSNRLTARVLVVAAMGAAAMAAGVPGVYATTGTWNSNYWDPSAGTVFVGNSTLGTITEPSGATFATPANGGTNPGYWLNGAIPNGVGDTANFTYNISAAKTINLSTMTLGTLNMASDNFSFTLDSATAGNVLTLDASPGGPGGTAQINILGTNLSGTSQVIGSANLAVNLVDNTTITINSGNTGAVSPNDVTIAGGSLTGAGNLTIEGGGTLTVNSVGAGYTGTIIVDKGALSTNYSGAFAVQVLSGGTIFASGTSATAMHITGTGNHNIGALVVTGAMGTNVVLDGNASVGSYGGTISGIISDNGNGYSLTRAYSGTTNNGHQVTGQALTLNAANTYTGGTFLSKGAGVVAITALGSVQGNVTVEGLSQLQLVGTAALPTGKVILHPGFVSGYAVINSGDATPSPTGNFVTAGGGLVLAADFDPTSVIDSTSSGGYVALGANSTQSFNVFGWGDGTLRLGAITAGTTVGTFAHSTGTISAFNAGDSTSRTLLLGDTGTNTGPLHAGFSTLQINSSLLAYNGSTTGIGGVDIKAGIVLLNSNTNTYTGDTNIGYNGTLTVNGNGANVGNASHVFVNGGGTLNMNAATGVANGMITVNGGGVVALIQAGVAAGGLTVQGVDPGNGVSKPYQGVVTYGGTNTAVTTGVLQGAVLSSAANNAGTWSVVGGVTANKGGLVILDASYAGTDRMTINDLGVVRGTLTQLNAQLKFNTATGAGNLVLNNGAVIQNTNAAGTLSSTVAPLVAQFGNNGNLYYGIAANGSGENFTIGSTSGTPWKGLAGGNLENVSTGAGANSTTAIITLSGNADLVGLSNGLTGNTTGSALTADNFGLGANVGGNVFTVSHRINGTATQLTIRGGGTVAINNINNLFTAPIVIDQATLQVDPGGAGNSTVFQDTILGNANNTVTMQNGGRLVFFNETGQYILAATRQIIVAASGGSLGMASDRGIMTVSTENQISGSGQLNIVGNGQIELGAAQSTLTGAVNVASGQLKLTHPNALANVSGVSVGIAQGGLNPVGIMPYNPANTSNFFVNDIGGATVGYQAGSILLSPFISYNIAGNTAHPLHAIVQNGGAIGFDGDMALSAADINLGQKFVSGLVTPLIDNFQASRTPVLPLAQMVKLLHVGGEYAAGTMTMPFAITDALSGDGTAVALMKDGHNMTLDLRTSGPNTYTGGTFIGDGQVLINAANQLGNGGILIAGAFGNAAAQVGILHVMDNDGNVNTLNTVTFNASQAFTFMGNSTSANLGNTIAPGNAVVPPTISVDQGVLAVITNLGDADQGNTSAAPLIYKTGAGTLRLQIAANDAGKWASYYSLYLKEGSVETDAMPDGPFQQRAIIFDGGSLTVNAVAPGSSAGLMAGGGSTGFSSNAFIVRNGGTLFVHDGAEFKAAGIGGSGALWNGTLVMDGDSVANSLISLGASSTTSTTNGNGVLDLRNVRLSLTGGSGSVIPWDNATFTVKLNGGELDGTDSQRGTNATFPLGVGELNGALVVNNLNTAGTSRIGGPGFLTVAGNGNTTFNGTLEKTGSGTLAFNRNVTSTFVVGNNSILKISGGQVIIDGNTMFAGAAFLGANLQNIVNNSATDTLTGSGLVFNSNDPTAGNRHVASITGTGGTLINANTTLIVGASPGVITQGFLSVVGNVRNDGDTTFADPLGNAGAVTITGNSATALNIAASGVAKLGDVSLTGGGTGGVLNGSLTANSLSMTSATSSFTQNPGSTLALTNTVVINNGQFNYNGGTQNISAINSSNPANGAVHVAANQSMTLNEVRQGGTLRIDAGASVLMNQNGADSRVNVVGALQLAGTTNAWTSKLELQNNDLIVNATAATATATRDAVLNQVLQGRGPNADWTGTNGITSQAANTVFNNIGGEVTTLAVVLNSDRNDTAGALTTFDGQAVNDNSTLVKYTWNGDANMDGVIDSNDQNQLDEGFFFNLTPNWINGDFDRNGVIDGNDQNLLDIGFFFGYSQFGPLTGGTLGSGTSGGPTPVPEPASLALLGLGGVLLFKRRNRKV